MNLFFLFGFSCCLANILPLFFLSLLLLYFSPFFFIALYRCPLNQALWWSLGCGLVFDLYASQTKLGIYALNYCLSTFFLYGYKTHFFEDRLSTLPVMIFIYCFLSQLIQGALLLAIGKPFHYSWEWLRTDLFYIPLQTSLYGFLVFRGSLIIYKSLYLRLFSRR